MKEKVKVVGDLQSKAKALRTQKPQREKVRERERERGGEDAGMRFNNKCYKSHPFAAVFPSLLLNYMLLLGPPYLYVLKI